MPNNQLDRQRRSRMLGTTSWKGRLPAPALISHPDIYLGQSAGRSAAGRDACSVPCRVHHGFIFCRFRLSATGQRWHVSVTPVASSHTPSQVPVRGHGIGSG